MTWDNVKNKALTRAGPRKRGSLSIKVPAGTCKAGARYPAAEFGTDKRLYTLTDVVVTGCGAASGGDRPTESLSLNYTKISYSNVSMNDR